MSKAELKERVEELEARIAKLEEAVRFPLLWMFTPQGADTNGRYRFNKAIQ
jgi:hypothetical protein